MGTTGAVIRHPECDVRPWLREHEGRVHPYTVQRITQSYLFIDDLVSKWERIGSASAFDVGCGAGYDTFAIGRHFDHVLAIDIGKRAIREACFIAHGAGVPNVTFERANIESFRDEHEFDFVYCNLMSHNVASRCDLMSRLRQAMKPGSHLLYSEITEGYAPMEIHRAIVARDQVQLVSRIWQVLRGFTGQGGFRFFLAGSAPSLLEAGKFCMLAHEAQDWNGMKIFERMTARAESGTSAPVRSLDRDYLDLRADLAELRAQFKEMLASRPQGGFSSSQRSRIESLSDGGRGRHAPFLLYLLMADIVLASSRPDPSILRRLRRVWRREPSLPGVGPCDLALRDTFDWAALEELHLRVIRGMRRNSGLPADSMDD